MLLASDTFSYPVFLRKGDMKWSYLSVSAYIITVNPKDNFNHVSGRRRCLKACENMWMDGRERGSGTHPAKDGGDPSYIWPAQLTAACTPLQRNTGGNTGDKKSSFVGQQASLDLSPTEQLKPLRGNHHAAVKKIIKRACKDF